MFFVTVSINYDYILHINVTAGIRMASKRHVGFFYDCIRTDEEVDILGVSLSVQAKWLYISSYTFVKKQPLVALSPTSLEFGRHM